MGNTLRGEDGVGPYGADYAETLDNPFWKSINAETVPENFTSEIRKRSPRVLVILDAADMGLEYGQARIIPHEKMGVMHFSTHAIPLSVFLELMKEYSEEVYLMGIQIDISHTELGMEMDEETQSVVRRNVEKLFTSGPRSFPSL